VRVNRDLMDAMTATLLEHEVIDGETLKSLLGRVLSDVPAGHLAGATA
jgi:ATP-dependent Zn protease